MNPACQLKEGENLLFEICLAGEVLELGGEAEPPVALLLGVKAFSLRQSKSLSIHPKAVTRLHWGVGGQRLGIGGLVLGCMVEGAEFGGEGLEFGGDGLGENGFRVWGVRG